MILSQVREIVTRAIDEPLPRLDVIAFHNGQEIPSGQLARMIDAATRGHITPDGEKIFLIPRKTYEQAKKESVKSIREYARRKKLRIPRNPKPSPSIKKTQCFTLTSYLPPTGARESENDPQRPRKSRVLGTKTRHPARVPKGSAKSPLKRSVCVDDDGDTA